MHWNPDGDALGSALGLVLGLRALGRQPTLVSPQSMPEIYDFLPTEGLITFSSPVECPDLVIILDCDRSDRVGELQPLVECAKSTLIIDHHPATTDIGTFRLTDESAAATAEIVYHFLRSRNIEITYPIAQALLTALITDTGGFRFRNTRALTLQMASELTAVGPLVADIAERVYDTRSFESLKLMGRALSSLRRSPSGNVAWAKLSHTDFAESGAKPEDTEGFVNLVQSLKGTLIAAIMREESRGVVRVSLRGREGTTVNGAAEALGGGGHALAAACIIDASLDEAEARVLEELAKWTEF